MGPVGTAGSHAGLAGYGRGEGDPELPDGPFFQSSGGLALTPSLLIWEGTSVKTTAKATENYRKITTFWAQSDLPGSPSSPEHLTFDAPRKCLSPF